MEFMDRYLKSAQQPKRDENHHLSFFRGLLPSMEKLNEAQALEFQGGVIKLLQNIREQSTDIKPFCNNPG